MSVDGEWAQSQRPIFSATTCLEGGSGRNQVAMQGLLDCGLTLPGRCASTFPSVLHPDSEQSIICRCETEAEAKVPPLQALQA